MFAKDKNIIELTKRIELNDYTSTSRINIQQRYIDDVKEYVDYTKRLVDLHYSMIQSLNNKIDMLFYMFIFSIILLSLLTLMVI